MRITTTTVAGAALVTALAVGALVPAAFAQEASQDPSEETATQHEQRHEQMEQQLAEALATELGLDTETVAAALEQVRADFAEQRRADRRDALEERLDAAVEDGSLTREQADALLDAQESGVLRGLGPRGEGGRGGHGGPGGWFGPQAVPDGATTPSADASPATATSA